MCENKGLCDCGKPATTWLYNTSASYCDNDACRLAAIACYEEHCRQCEIEDRLERERVELYGE